MRTLMRQRARARGLRRRINSYIARSLDVFLYDARHNAYCLIATRYRSVHLLTLLFNPRESISIFKYPMTNA